MDIGFYLLGKKGFEVISAFLDKFGAKRVSFVIIATDKNISNDYSSDIEKVCIRHKVHYVFRSALKEAKSLDSLIAFAVGWRWLINRSDNLVVLHDSLLPKYRGFSPLVNMLINKEPEIGVTALLASSEYDKGDIVGQLKLAVTYPLKIQDAINSISMLYVKLVLSIAESLFSGDKLKPIKQKEKFASYSLWRNDEDYAIDWSKSAEYICRFIDSVSQPYLGAVSYIGNKKIRIEHAEELENVVVEDRENHLGKVIFFQNERPCVVCGNGVVKLVNATSELSGTNILTGLSFRTRFTSQRVNLNDFI